MASFYEIRIKTNSLYYILKIIFIFFIILSVNCDNNLKRIQKYKILENSVNENPALSISKAISDVIDKFHIINDLKIDLIVYGEKSVQINDIINEINNQNIPKTLKHIKNITDWNHFLSKSAVIFIKSETTFNNFLSSSLPINDDKTRLNSVVPEKLKFLIYVEEIKIFYELENFIKKFNLKYFLYNVDIRFYEFFITSDGKTLNLTANLFYSEHHCGYFKAKTLNSFNLIQQKWNKKLENFDYFSNFHGCLLNFLVPYSSSFYLDNFQYYKISAEAHIKFKDHLSHKNPKFRGSITVIIESMAKKSNFTFHYTTSTTKDNKLVLHYTGNFHVFENNFHVLFYEKVENKSVLHYATPHEEISFYYLLSYNDLYTNYEKLLFPFDTATWLLIAMTFGITFAIIFRLQFAPQWIMTLVYGKGVNNPGFNAVSIFFGISQLKLPNETICRFILLIFLWFCLIIRTCWQSKMFEFITTDMRKPLPKSIEDLKDMNYTILLYNYQVIKDLNEKIIKGRESPEVVISSSLFMEEYKKAIDGKSQIKYAFFINKVDHLQLNITFKRSLPKMENERIGKVVAYAMPKNSILIHDLNYIIDRLLPSGILTYLNDFGKWYMFRPFDEEIEDSKKILSMLDLEFGFVIFLNAVVLAIIIFICELHALYVKRQLRKLLGLYEFLKVLRVRLRDYHDKWT